jgi:outer membrane protein assembly factor BamB
VSGDMFLAIGDLAFRETKGKYAVLHTDGTSTGDVLVDRNRGYTAGCAVDPIGGALWTTSADGNTVSVFEGAGFGLHPLLQTISVRSFTFRGGQARGAVGSLVFDADGNVLAGTYDGANELLKISQAGAILDRFALPAGVKWFDLASDQHTIYYTSADTVIRRYDLATRSPVPDFTALPDGTVSALRLLPNNQGLLVAGSISVYWLDLNGTRIKQYWRPAMTGYHGATIAADGRSFWTWNEAAELYRVDLTTARVLSGPIATGFPRLRGLCIKHEYTAAEDVCRVVSGNGQPQTVTCPRLEACGNQTDEDLDGLADELDPDCTPAAPSALLKFDGS